MKTLYKESIENTMNLHDENWLESESKRASDIYNRLHDVETSIFISTYSKYSDINILYPNENFKKHTKKRMLFNNGLADKNVKKLNDFLCHEQWQKNIKEKIVDYLSKEKYLDKWFLIGGQTGVGKTHVCLAIYKAITEIKEIRGVMMKYEDDIRVIKAQMTKDPYVLDRFKNTPMLYIDNLYIGSNNSMDKSVIRQIIDYRYDNDLLTIISTRESDLNTFMNIEESVSSMILEKCGTYYHFEPYGKNKNYRQKKCI